MPYWLARAGQCGFSVYGETKNVKMTVDIIIPVYKPGEEFATLLIKLHQMSDEIGKVILANTEKAYWESFERDYPKESCYPELSVFHVTKEAFDHGGTRREAISRSKADIFVCMTQDALPADADLIRNLIAALTQKADIAAAYARQLPKNGADVVECYTRAFNYPETGYVRYARDLSTYGIKAFFCSNVCAAYKRDIYEEMGGFVKQAIFNEDMIYAGNCIRKGYGIAYAAEAKVYHSHHYSGRQQYHRNFDLGVSQAEHPEVFEGVLSESEGKKLVKKTVAYLIKAGKGYLIPKLVWQSGCKYLGYRAGKRYKRLSHKSILRKTGNQAYFQRKWEKEKTVCAE